MLSFNFSKLFIVRGITRPSRYLLEQGFSPNFATKIVFSRFERIDLKSLERLCVLFNCTPNDLLEWTPDAKSKENPDHPLYALRKPDEAKVMKLTQTINSLPLDSLDEVQQAVESIKEKKAGKQELKT